ncbi:MAG: ATP synthase F0 subunit B [Nitrospirae bacterium]|nr:MAG: ATP synthase F0 subunit B [Nitrospirota bacterium]
MPQFESHFFSSLMFWEVVSFAILLWILAKYAFPPILETLEARERKIRESLEQADRHRAEAERKMHEYEAKLAAAAKEAEALFAAARERAQRVQEENEQRLQADAERIKGDAQREIDAERRKAIQDIRNQTTDLALLVAEKVLGRSLNDADHRRLADEALAAAAKQFQKN